MHLNLNPLLSHPSVHPLPSKPSGITAGPSPSLLRSIVSRVPTCDLTDRILQRRERPNDCVMQELLSRPDREKALRPVSDALQQEEDWNRLDWLIELIAGLYGIRPGHA